MAVTMNMSLRERLKEVREEIAGLRDERASARTQRDAAREAFAAANHGDKKITEWPEFVQAEDAVKKVGELDDKLADLQLAEQGILKMLGDEQGSPDPGGNDRGAHSGLDLSQMRGWDGHRLLEAQGSAYQNARELGLFTSTNKFGAIELGKIASREDAMRFMSELPAAPAGTFDSTAGAPAIAQDRRGTIAPLLRPLRFLDLIPTGTTDSNTVEYVQVTAIPSSAAPVAEGALKPSQGLTLLDATAPVRTIAGWIKVNRQAMDDTAGLASLINTLLPYDVRRQIEKQVLAGDGTGQNLRGILNTSGIGSPTFVTADNTADAILRAMTVIILADQEPNFVAMHPIDWQNLLLLRETGGIGASRAGQYLYGGPGSMAAASVWGMTITPSTAVTAGTPLVGDSNACTLLFREAVNVKASDSDQDDFVKNRVTILAEARVAFPVWRPSGFSKANTS